MLDDSSPHERQRLELLACTRLLDSEENESFDRITRLAAALFDAPMALVSLVDQRRQWFKSRIGLAVRETERSSSFCSHALAAAGVTVIEDARLDARFTDNPMVTGAPHIRFYAGAPLRLASGHALGTLCIIDTRPRTFGAADCARLADLAELVMAQVDLHQLAGRIDGVTRLPNRARLNDDLETLCQQFPGERRALMLIDVMGYAQLQAAVRAVGVGPLEGTMREIAAKLRSQLRPRSRRVSRERDALRLPRGGRATERGHDAAATRLVDRMREPFTSGGISVELDIQGGLVEFALEPVRRPTPCGAPRPPCTSRSRSAGLTCGTATRSTRRTGAATPCCATCPVACSAASSGWSTSPSSTCAPAAIRAWRRWRAGRIPNWATSRPASSSR